MSIRRLPQDMVAGLTDLINAASFPVGSVVFSPKGTVFAGFLELDGSTFSSTTYPDLYSYLGSTTLPDYRDRVLRHAGTLAGAVSTLQEDAMQDHKHNYNIEGYSLQEPALTGANSNADINTAFAHTNQFNAVTTLASAAGARASTETRVKAAIGKFLIKAASVPGNSGTVDMLALATDVAGKVNKTDIVGTLSSSGNGRIIERGSNANGDYVKFADGTLICWKRHTVTHTSWTGHGSLFYSDAFTWSFPATFSAAPMASGIGRVAAALSYLSSAGGTETGIGLSVHAVSPINAGVSEAYYRLMAVGRWF